MSTDTVAAPATGVDPSLAEPGTRRISEAVSRLFRLTARAKHEMSQRDPEMRDYAVMLAVAQLIERGPVRSGDLAGCMHLDPSQVSRHVAAAVKDGLVERRADPDDGRATLLVPTELGRARQAHFAATRARQLDQITADWDPVDIDRFAGLFERFVAAFERTFTRGAAGTSESPLHPQTSQQEIA